LLRDFALSGRLSRYLNIKISQYQNLSNLPSNTFYNMNFSFKHTLLLSYILLAFFTSASAQPPVDNSPASVEEIATPVIMLTLGPDGSYQPVLKSVITKELVYNTVDVTPKAKAGGASVINFFKDNLKTLKNDKGEPVLTGLDRKVLTQLVIVQVTIDKSGKLINPRVVSSPDPKLNEVALRLLTLFGKDKLNDWSPAQRGGKVVHSHYNISIPLI
jgi:hypothetical protein